MIAELLVMAAMNCGPAAPVSLVVMPLAESRDAGVSRPATVKRPAGQDGLQEVDQKTPKRAVEASPEAQALLKVAWQVKRNSFKKDPEEKSRILHEAVEAFAKVIKEYPEARLECGEAWFRIGEIHRSLDEQAEAEAAFTKGLDYPENPRFRARCLLELGHMRRRAGEVAKAVAFYERVMKEQASERNEASQAMSWAGKVELASSDAEKGRKRLLDFEKAYPEYPEAAIRNIDRVALWLIESGRLDEARKLVDDARSRFLGKAEDDPKTRAGIQKALTRMRASARLSVATSTGGADGADRGDGREI